MRNKEGLNAADIIFKTDKRQSNRVVAMYGREVYNIIRPVVHVLLGFGKSYRKLLHSQDPW